MGWNDPVVGGTALRLPAIQSPNYEAGLSGWSVFQDGTAEFSDLTVRGTIVIEQTPDGVFIYGFQPITS